MRLEESKWTKIILMNMENFPPLARVSERKTVARGQQNQTLLDLSVNSLLRQRLTVGGPGWLHSQGPTTISPLVYSKHIYLFMVDNPWETSLLRSSVPLSAITVLLGFTIKLGLLAPFLNSDEPMNLLSTLWAREIDIQPLAISFPPTYSALTPHFLSILTTFPY